MGTIGSVVDGSLEILAVSDCMKGERRLYVATHDIMVMRRRRKGESLPPPLPPKLLRAGFMAKGGDLQAGRRRETDKRGGEEKEVCDSRNDGV